MNNKLVSVIIPVYNEEEVITTCLNSLKGQTLKPLEIIVVDDGSTDKTISLLRHPDLEPFDFAQAFDSEAAQARRGKLREREGSTIKLFHQDHRGPGPARNLGAKHAKGEILVFVDADMTFDKNFIKDLTNPISSGQTVGTFSKNEMNANRENIWSRCWNINRGWPVDRLIPLNYPSVAPVFRAILKKEFDKVSGFDATGEYTDDWSLSRKLGKKSTLARGAVYYHKNPATLKEVWKQARWIGKNEFISGTTFRRIRSLILYAWPMSLLFGTYKSFLNLNFSFLIFKLIHDTAIWISTIKSFLGERKSK